MKKKIILPILVLIILVILYLDNIYIFKKVSAKNQFLKETIYFAEENKTPIFKISKIIKYSSAEAIDNTVEQNLQNLSIHQYSDIALYIDNFSEELTEENTVKELYIDNFNIDINYKYGKPTLYYKNPLEISKFRMIDKNEIQDSLHYNIIYTNEENENNKYENPTFFADCSNPITIGYINKNIINNYEVTKQNSLVAFDGRIFNNMDINVNDLSPKISFTIHLKNNLNESFVCNIGVDLQLETKEGSVKSGYIIEKTDNIQYYNFLKETNRME